MEKQQMLISPGFVRRKLADGEWERSPIPIQEALASMSDDGEINVQVVFDFVVPLLNGYHKNIGEYQYGFGFFA